MVDTVMVLNGPNLNLLGTREPHLYGSESLSDVETLCADTAAALGFAVDFRQSNHEGVVIDAVHQAAASCVGIVINPAGLSHTSISLLDALIAVTVPVVEVHISNIHRREPFRHTSYVSTAAAGVIVGCGIQGYAFAIQRLAQLVRAAE